MNKFIQLLQRSLILGIVIVPNVFAANTFTQSVTMPESGPRNALGPFVPKNIKVTPEKPTTGQALDAQANAIIQQGAISPQAPKQ